MPKMNKLSKYILNSAKKNIKLSDKLQKFEEKEKHTHKRPAAIMLEHAEQGVIYEAIKGNTAVGSLGGNSVRVKTEASGQKRKTKVINNRHEKRSKCSSFAVITPERL